MKTTFALPLLAMAIAACDTFPNDPYGQGPAGYPGPAPYPDAYPQPGYPVPVQGMFNLANTNWRVATINGQPMPMSGYYFNFAPDRMSGKLGCNTIGAGYAVNGSTLTVGALMMTRMACPAGSHEAQGVAILSRPLMIAESGDTLTLSNSVGAMELVRAR